MRAWKKRRSCSPCYGIEKRRICVVFSFHLFFLNAVCWCLGLQGSGWHIKALSLKSSKLVVNSAWNPACMPVNQGFFEIINHFQIKVAVFLYMLYCWITPNTTNSHNKRTAMINLSHFVSFNNYISDFFIRPPPFCCLFSLFTTSNIYFRRFIMNN